MCFATGVRVSGFISAEDKKPLQRSIMGFLQKGGSDTGSFTQCAGSVLKAEEDSDGASFLKPQSTEMKVPSVSEQKPKSIGPQQQSFFKEHSWKDFSSSRNKCLSSLVQTQQTIVLTQLLLHRQIYQQKTISQTQHQQKVCQIQTQGQTQQAT